MQLKKRILFYSILFLVLLLGFWFFLFYGTDDWKSKLPVMGYVEPFAFVNQNGDTVTQATTQGKVYVANYFFTSCTGICPYMNGNVKKLYGVFKNTPDLLFLSHTCQPETDSLPVLKHYADSLDADVNQWQFVTGNKLELYKTARESYHIDDSKNNVGKIEDQFLHSQFLALVDKSGRLRGIYDGLKTKEVNQLQQDIGGLLKEKAVSGFVGNVFGNALAQ